MVDRKMEDNIAQFCGVTGASCVPSISATPHPSIINNLCDSFSSSTKDARKFLEKYKRVDIAVDAYYTDPNALATSPSRTPSTPAASTSKLNALFDKYKGACAHPSIV